MSGEASPLKRAHRRFGEAILARRRKGEDQLDRGLDPAAERAICHAALDALRAWLAPGNREPFPKDVALYLETQLAFVVDGIRPPSWWVLMRDGRGTRHWPIEAECRRAAVLYIRAARAGIVSDPAPVKTVAEWFGATPEAIKKWLAKYPHVTPDDFRPDLAQEAARAEAAVLEVRRLDMAGVPYKRNLHSARAQIDELKAARVTLLVALAKKAGEVYRAYSNKKNWPLSQSGASVKAP